MRLAAIVYALVLAAGLGGLVWLHAASRGGAGPPPLTVFCAASLKPPLEELAVEHRRRGGGELQLQYGGTGALLAQLETARQGDLFLAADRLAVDAAQSRGLAREVVPLGRQRPVVVVPRGNPEGIAVLEDLFRDDVRVAVGNPEAASIGLATQRALGPRWEEFARRAAAMKPTVTELATDVRLGAADAAIVWNTVAPQFPQLDVVRLPELDACPEDVSAVVLVSSRQPERARAFARFLADPEFGGRVLRARGFEPPDAAPPAEGRR